MIEAVRPEIDGGRFPIKRTLGEKVVVEADIFADGHNALSARLRYRKAGARNWRELAMQPGGNDRWRASFVVTDLGRYEYTLEAWVDHFKTWRRDLAVKVDAGQNVDADLLMGADLIESAAGRLKGKQADQLDHWARQLRSDKPLATRLELAMGEPLRELMAVAPDDELATAYGKRLEVVVDPELARFSAWYELFPRSCSPEAGRHGTFKDCEAWLPRVARMGFDVVYLPPIHPIGKTKRKGANNVPEAGPHDPGSPWAIGAEEGGHKSLHPDLGTLQDFRRFVDQAKEHGLEVALDIAYQCSPDHPYVQEHPEWFRRRPDGTIQYAENPPKKYEDIVPLDFECDEWRDLWLELESVVRFWIDQGVRLFRVDNPHTKPFAFWEWLIGSVRRDHPDVVFLSEAFTRPKVMYRLAKLGFNQSYTYFAWRNTQWELSNYLQELTRTELLEYFRPNFWANTPDILTEYLQTGGRPAFAVRLVLAATLSSSYGIYGPAFELCESRPRQPGSEEYLDSEKYQIRQWDLEAARPMEEFIRRINRLRRQEPAMQSNRNLVFHATTNPQLLCYSKRTDDFTSVVLVVVNLDPHHKHTGWVDLDTAQLGLAPEQAYQVHDMLGEARFHWQGSRSYVELDPHQAPAHLFRVRRQVRREQDFEYYF